MSNHKQDRYKNRQRDNIPDMPSDDNKIVASFRQYARELDDKHDRYERIIKQSRDITIESKRIIFLLHTIDPKKQNAEKILKEATVRLDAICGKNFKNIARELNGRDPYQFTRAYNPGLQEFIEAYTYAEYLQNKTISDWQTIQEKLKYNYHIQDVNEESKEPVIDNPSVESQKDLEMICLIQPIEFILGLGDVGGEVMRRCINSLGSGDIDACFKACKFLQLLYTGFSNLSYSRLRDLNFKIYTLHQSVIKVENVCYNIKVRGSEAAKRGNLGDEKLVEHDEGYANY